MDNLFYFLGVALVVLALVVSFTGIRFKDFPRNRAQMAGGLAIMIALVASTATFAVILSTNEKEKRNNEKADALAQEPAGNQGATSPTESGQAAQQTANVEQGSTTSGQTTTPAAAEKVPLSSPSSGNLLYDTSKLSAKAGAVTVDYTNPSATPHSVAIEDSGGQQLAAGDIVANGESVATAELQPGKYTYYCTVPGHREAGMQGTLTVK